MYEKSDFSDSDGGDDEDSQSMPSASNYVTRARSRLPRPTPDGPTSDDSCVEVESSKPAPTLASSSRPASNSQATTTTRPGKSEPARTSQKGETDQTDYTTYLSIMGALSDMSDDEEEMELNQAILASMECQM